MLHIIKYYAEIKWLVQTLIDYLLVVTSEAFKNHDVFSSLRFFDTHHPQPAALRFGATSAPVLVKAETVPPRP